jgi:hypothetical protein
MASVGAAGAAGASGALGALVAVGIEVSMAQVRGRARRCARTTRVGVQSEDAELRRRSTVRKTRWMGEEKEAGRSAELLL